MPLTNPTTTTSGNMSNPYPYMWPTSIDYSAMNPMPDAEFVDMMVKGICEIIDEVGEEVKNLQFSEPDSSYRDRCVRDIKATGYSKILELLERMV